jgi:hypothetical protein
MMDEEWRMDEDVDNYLYVDGWTEVSISEKTLIWIGIVLEAHKDLTYWVEIKNCPRSMLDSFFVNGCRVSTALAVC